MSFPLQLEVCIASVDDTLAAAAGGADRLELNCALDLGGLTPSPGLLLEVKRVCRLPIFVMIRPRPGGFCYSAADFDVMRRDAEWMIANGADGLVFGVLHENGKIDVERCRALFACGAGRPAVFHRAFDVTPDPLAALETLIELSFARVLTSGQQPTALEGAPLIAELIRRAAGRIEILPGGGINAGNVAEVMARTGCNQIHGSFRSARRDESVSARPAVSFGKANPSSEDGYESTDRAAVAAVRRLIGP